VNNFNRLLLNADNKIGYKVNVLKCPEYVEALERLAYDKSGTPDKSSGFDHITDAAGYFLYYEFPSSGKYSAYW
jgi:hypothetical protein